MPTKTNPSIENKGWEKILDSLLEDFGKEYLGFYEYGSTRKELNFALNNVKSFIRTELAKAKGEERERIIEFVQINQKGTFTDDGGNDCWYIDDLVNSLKEKKW